MVSVKPTKVSFSGLKPASLRASQAAKGASAHSNTRCELALREELHRRGLRFQLHRSDLPGRPDIVFPKERVAVFCDGDFWHGRDLITRLGKLARGHNSGYWIAKVVRNTERDKLQTQALRNAGWLVMRFWETEVLRSRAAVAARVKRAVARRRVDTPSEARRRRL